MVQVNLESLSTSELRNLAEQEQITSLEDMDREDLLEALQERYEEDGVSVAEENRTDNMNLKFMSSFSDYKNISASVSELPGVEELPEYYQETCIHLLYKNSDWGYAFWSIATLDQEQIDEEKGVVILTVTVFYRNGHKETYDIPISNEDKEWNIGFSTDGEKCHVSLVEQLPNGKRKILAQSKDVKMVDSYWLNHKDEMKADDGLFRIYLSLLTTKKGDVIDNSIVKDILKDYLEEDQQ